MTEIESLLILNGILGLGNIRIRKLFEHFGSASQVLSASRKELTAGAAIPASVADNIIRFPKDEYLKSEYSLMEKHGVRAVSYEDQDYPENLNQIPDAPVLLYVKGDLKKENNLAVAIVGSRKASFYGLSIAEKFARELSEFGITIVSGMARGIDTKAHEGALRAKGPTIAVLGNGLSEIYPPENQKLFEDIAKNGAIISEFPMTTPPAAYNFPRRNRVISGLSLGVVIVEASNKSGALITSRFALEQGREVFAVPGKVDSPNSQGVHKLIKEGAKLTNSVSDILEELAPQLKHRIKEEKPISDTKFEEKVLTRNLSNEEKTIYGRISDQAMHIDEIVDQSGCSASQAMAVLLKLELKHLIRQLPGKLFVKTGINA